MAYLGVAEDIVIDSRVAEIGIWICRGILIIIFNIISIIISRLPDIFLKTQCYTYNRHLL